MVCFLIRSNSVLSIALPGVVMVFPAIAPALFAALVMAADFLAVLLGVRMVCTSLLFRVAVHFFAAIPRPQNTTVFRF